MCYFKCSSNLIRRCAHTHFVYGENVNKNRKEEREIARASDREAHAAVFKRIIRHKKWPFSSTTHFHESCRKTPPQLARPVGWSTWITCTFTRAQSSALAARTELAQFEFIKYSSQTLALQLDAPDSSPFYTPIVQIGIYYWKLV